MSDPRLESDALARLHQTDELAATISEHARFLINNGADIDFAIRAAVLEHLG